MALYSWFNRKENNGALTDNKQTLSIMLDNEKASNLTSVWPTTTVNSALSKGSPITQMTYSSYHGKKLIPLRLLTIKST